MISRRKKEEEREKGKYKKVLKIFWKMMNKKNILEKLKIRLSHFTFGVPLSADLSWIAAARRRYQLSGTQVR